MSPPFFWGCGVCHAARGEAEPLRTHHQLQFGRREGRPFSSRFNSFKKRQSVACAMILGPAAQDGAPPGKRTVNTDRDELYTSWSPAGEQAAAANHCSGKRDAALFGLLIQNPWLLPVFDQFPFLRGR